MFSSLCVCSYFFFFFKQKTAYEMRISDWSSDVCSSDLGADGDFGPLRLHGFHEADSVRAAVAPFHALQDHVVARLQRQMQMRHHARLAGDRLDERWIGDRKSVV